MAGSADTNLIGKWDGKLKSCQQARMSFEHQWLENISFMRGRQWIVTQKNTASGGFTLSEQPTQDRWRVRHTANRILRIVRKELTNLTKEEPQFYCMPDSTEEADRLAAMAGDSIAEYLIRTKYFNRRRREATLWALLCGTAYLKNYYAPSKLELDGQPGKIDFEAVSAFHLFVPNLFTTELEEQPYVVHARTVNPEEVFNTYGVEIPADTDSASIMDSRFLSLMGVKNNKTNDTKQCYLKEVYVKPCKDFPNGAMFVYGANQMLYVYEAPEMPEMQQPGMLPEGAQDPQAMLDQLIGKTPQGIPLDNSAPVGPPVPAVLNGAPPALSKPPVGADPGITNIDGQPVDTPRIRSDEPGLQNYDHEYCYRHGRFPFAKIDHIMTGMFYGESVIQHLIPSQREYNRTRSIMLENRNLAGKPQWWYTAGSFDPRKFNSKPGLMIPINMGFEPPQPLAQPALPESMPAELMTTIQDMDDISAQTEVSKGSAPPGVEAASAIAYLSEENDTILHPSVASIEEAVQETGVQILANVYDYWPTDRIVRMTSKNQYMEVREFKSGDLNPLTDFRVESGSMAPRSLAAKQAFLTELMKIGALEPRQAFRYLGMSETNKMYEDMMLDSRQANRENVYMAQGQKLTKPMPGQQPVIDPETQQLMPQNKTDVLRDPMSGEPMTDPTTGEPKTYDVTTNPFDAHDAHIEEHENFQKSQEYELLPPEIQQIIQDHVDEHKMELLKERNAAQADEAAKPESTTTDSPRLDQGSEPVGPQPA
jgi:hypothetical protein